MRMRQFVISVTLSIAVVSLLATGSATTPDQSAGGTVVLANASLPGLASENLTRQLLGQWQADNGTALLLLQGDGTYGYSVSSSNFSTSEQGTYRVSNTQLTLSPTSRTAEVNGQEVPIRSDPLVMSIGADSQGNLVLDFKGSLYHKA